MFAKYGLIALAIAALAPAAARAGTVTQTNLVSDGAVPAAVTDPNLKNPWGVSYAPGGPFWVSDNANGLSTLYTGAGAISHLVVTIPAAGGGTGAGSPTGQVFNATADFKITSGGATGTAFFIFVTEDGTISGWNPSVNPNAVVAVDRSAFGAVFKGAAAYTDATTGRNYLLVTDFRGGVVDVFDGNFRLISAFRDKTLPDDYAPYNIAVLNGALYVTYAQVDAARHDSVNRNGAGAVEAISLSTNSSGSRLSPVVHARAVHGALNGPWGLAIAPTSFDDLAGDLLVGNFGSGQVAVFTPGLTPHGVLHGSGKKPLVIDGLWALITGNGGAGGAAGTVYFTAGPNREVDGLLGALAYTP